MEITEIIVETVEHQVGFVPKKNLIGKAEIIFFSHNSTASIFEFWKWHKAIRFSRIGKAIE